MIAAVKVESHALFSVKEKLQEMDNLRDQLVNVNRRMVEQEQTNLNLKQSLIQEQQTISELRKQKSDVIYPPHPHDLSYTKLNVLCY